MHANAHSRRVRRVRTVAACVACTQLPPDPITADDSPDPITADDSPDPITANARKRTQTQVNARKRTQTHANALSPRTHRRRVQRLIRPDAGRSVR